MDSFLAPIDLETGEAAPWVVKVGNYSVQLMDVPSRNIRDEFTAAVTKMFPGTDRIEVERLMETGRFILIRNVDEESAERILKFARRFKISGSIVPNTEPGKYAFLVNPGTLTAAVCALLAFIITGKIGLILFLAGLGAAAVGSWSKLKRSLSVAAVPHYGSEADVWLDMAREYRAVAEKAPAPVTARVRAVCEAVFEVTASLNKKTLVSLVAGETTGRLYERMKEAAVSAIRIGAEIARTADPEEARLLEEELEKLAQAAENMRRRRLELERGGSTRPSSEIADDIDYLAQRAEKLIREVRPLDSRYSEKYRID